MSPIDSCVNKYNINSKPIHQKVSCKKLAFKGFKAILWFIPSILISLIAYIFTGSNPFDIISYILFDTYCQNISDKQKITLTKLINDIFDEVFNSVQKKINDLIDLSIKKYDIESKTLKKFESIKDSLKNIAKNSKKINILLIGKTGVGKSTLINGLLKENVSKESMGKIGTLEFKEYTSSNWENICLIDSQGFDFSKPFQVFTKESLQFIENSNNNKLKFIDLIFYCFNGTRFEDNEAELITNLLNIYEQEKTPIIFINTQSI